MTSPGTSKNDFHARPALRLACLLTLLAAFPLAAAQPDTPPEGALSAESSRQVIASWRADLDEVEAKLKAGEPKAAKRILLILIDEMNNHFHSGPLIQPMLARAAALRAVMEVDLGDKDVGVWYWHVAHQMHPAIGATDFSDLGTSGAFLETIEPRFPKGEDEEPAEEESAEEEPAEMGDLQPPRKRKAPRPRFPQAKRGLLNTVSVVVQIIIDEEGMPREPMVIEARGEPTLVFAVFDALQKWRFRPAKLDGVPVKAYYNLTANFQ